jgi:hypothetical protein
LTRLATRSAASAGSRSFLTLGPAEVDVHVLAFDIARVLQSQLEMCRVVDMETVYAPRHGNDRLLLGLKGSLNEYSEWNR